MRLPESLTNFWTFKMRVPPKCIEETNDPIKTPSEKGKTLIIDNPNRKKIKIIQVDDCVITIGEKCDILVEVDEKNLAIFVEFKGGDIRHAISQLETTIKAFKSRVSNKNKIALVISGKTYPSVKTYIQKAKLTFKKKLNTKLSTCNNSYKYQV